MTGPLQSLEAIVTSGGRTALRWTGLAASEREARARAIAATLAVSSMVQAIAGKTAPKMGYSIEVRDGPIIDDDVPVGPEQWIVGSEHLKRLGAQIRSAWQPAATTDFKALAEPLIAAGARAAGHQLDGVDAYAYCDIKANPPDEPGYELALSYVGVGTEPPVDEVVLPPPFHGALLCLALAAWLEDTNRKVAFESHAKTVASATLRAADAACGGRGLAESARPTLEWMRGHGLGDEAEALREAIQGAAA